MALHEQVSEWLLFNTKMNNLSAISWHEKVVKFDGMMMVYALY